MTVGPELRLAAMGLSLPQAPKPLAAYVPVRRVGDLLYVSGQMALGDGGLLAEGRLGAEVDIDTGVRCAQQCALNVLAQLKAELGALDRIRELVKLAVFVASDPSFTQQHVVANGASELFANVLGDEGKHARLAVGAASLPMNSPVELDAIVQVR